MVELVELVELMELVEFVPKKDLHKGSTVDVENEAESDNAPENNVGGVF